jgi:cytidylate kinase
MDADYDEILRQQNERDANDSNRQSGPLKAAGDAIVVYTDGLTEQQVLEKLLEIVRVRAQQVPS